METINDMIQNNIKYFENISSVMENFSRPATNQFASQDYQKFWEYNTEEYCKFVDRCFHMMGFVMKEEHRELMEKHESLKKKCQAQEEIIRQLKREKNSVPEMKDEMMTGIENLLTQQSKKFGDMLKVTENLILSTEGKESKSKKAAKKSKSTAKKATATTQEA